MASTEASSAATGTAAEVLTTGCVIPAHPLALNSQRKFNELRQRTFLTKRLSPRIDRSGSPAEVPGNAPFLFINQVWLWRDHRPAGQTRYDHAQSQGQDGHRKAKT